MRFEETRFFFQAEFHFGGFLFGLFYDDVIESQCFQAGYTVG